MSTCLSYTQARDLTPDEWTKVLTINLALQPYARQLFAQFTIHDENCPYILEDELIVTVSKEPELLSIQSKDLYRVEPVLLKPIIVPSYPDDDEPGYKCYKVRGDFFGYYAATLIHAVTKALPEVYEATDLQPDMTEFCSEDTELANKIADEVLANILVYKEEDLKCPVVQHMQ